MFRKAFEEHGYWQERQGTLIVVEPDGTIVGEVSFFPVHGSGPWWTSYELGYVLYDPERAGRGYMTEAVQLMVNHLFETKQIHRIQLTIAVENLASQAVAKRCGFTFEGIARGAFFMHGAPQDVQVWAILSTDERP